MLAVTNVQAAPRVTFPAVRVLKVAVKPLRASGTPGVVLPWSRPWVKLTLPVLLGQDIARSIVGVFDW